ncbi:MAG: hypothetical protein ACI4QI_06660 [Candidatus Coproplasma sp.]
MSDFKSFNRQRQENGTDGKDRKVNQGTDSKAKSGTKSGQGDPQAVANLTAEIAKAFYGKSTKDVWQAILSQAEEGKRNGTLTNEDLDNFYKTVYPLVDGAQRKKLKSIIAKLKEL